MSQSKNSVGEVKTEIKTGTGQGEELVEYTAPLLPGQESQEDVFVGVNGETVRFKRGVPVKLKRKFVEVLENAQTQELAAWKLMRTAQEQSGKAMAEM